MKSVWKKIVEVFMKKKLLMLMLLCATLSCAACGSVDFTENDSSNESNSQCPHTEVRTLPEVEATCSETGLTEGMECVACGEIIQAQEIIEIKAHTFDDANDKICNVCGFLNSTAPTFVVSETKAVVGSERVAVTVSVKNNPGIASIILSLNYDNTAMLLSEVEYNTEVGGQTVYPQELESPVTLYWINGFADVTGDWIFATLYFDISEEAIGEYDIQISYELDNVYNIAEENLNFKIINGKIIIK